MYDGTGPFPTNDGLDSVNFLGYISATYHGLGEEW